MRLRMRCLVLAMAAALAPSAAVYADDEPVEGDLKAFQGTWNPASDGGEDRTYVFEGNTLKIQASSRSYTMEITLDPTAKPEKTVDFRIIKGPDDARGKTSRGIYKLDPDGSLVLCFRPRGERPTKFEQVGFEQFLTVLKRKAETDEAALDAPLPEGWPGVTRPGEIEVKHYPAYRCAVNRAKEARMGGMGGLFWPLFLHITQKKIAMTAPVVMNYEPRMAADAEAVGDVSMEFLYRRPDQGESGQGFGPVEVEDRPATTVVSLGLQGRTGEARFRESIPRLRAWLDEHKAEWTEAGPPRMLGYHAR
ncbi:heme-binding protein [Planctomyces sp. SH-PL62]|uniref:heme-binding protein n=1 Tax=Planctomyces sp. SH-PL62 TaxID=1636152 RepID=UPI00078DF42E|nr:heme-binding protein [Planctomyces sp. SH-PL62]AMV36923.1 SOUL heme-binding protein [Planctomyces sp. SH-PL62]